MSFGASNTTKTAENNLGGVANSAFANNAAATGQGQGLLSTGGGNVQSGTNFFNTLLNGNQANTAALLQPSINQIGANNANTVSSLSTLMPRGGGRSGTLFNAAYAPAGQIQSLFNTGRTTAAQALPQIGLQQQGLGANLFGIGNQALGIAGGASGTLGNLGQQQQQITNSLFSSLGSGGLALLQYLAPTLGSSLGGLFGSIGSGGGNNTQATLSSDDGSTGSF